MYKQNYVTEFHSHIHNYVIDLYLKFTRLYMHASVLTTSVLLARVYFLELKKGAHVSTLPDIKYAVMSHPLSK